MGEEVIQALRGKVLRYPRKQKWMLIKEEGDEDEYEYTYEQRPGTWTPLNSNLHMQGIKVVVHQPVPRQVARGGGDSTQDTLLLLRSLSSLKKNHNFKKHKKVLKQIIIKRRV